jgi:hypothetical protein
VASSSRLFQARPLSGSASMIAGLIIRSARLSTPGRMPTIVDVMNVYICDDGPNGTRYRNGLDRHG